MADQKFQKAIFIGLGGSGIKTLAELKFKLFDNYFQKDKKSFDDNNFFIFVDTEKMGIERINSRYRNLFGNVDLIDVDKEFIDLGDINPVDVFKAMEKYKNDEGNYFLKWADKIAIDTMRSELLSKGAGTVRMAGRIGLYKKHKDLTEKIEEGLKKIRDKTLTSTNDDKQIDIWVISGSCGGTGSSICLDTLFLVESLSRLHTAVKTSQYVRLVIYMPFGYLEINKDKADTIYKPNGYAYLNELNLFLKDHRSEGENIYNFTVSKKDSEKNDKSKFPVFTYGIPIDIHTELDTHLKLDELYSNTAQLMYYSHVGLIGKSMKQDLKNSIDTLPDDSAWYKAFIPMGYRSLKGAGEYFKEYFEKRLIYELFYYGIIGNNFEFENVIKSENEQNKFVNNFIDKNIYNYVFTTNYDHQSINLGNILDNKKEECKIAYSDQIFNNDNGKKDKKKIKDQVTLNRYIQNARSIVDNATKSIHEIGTNYIKDIKDSVKSRILNNIETHIQTYGIKFTRELISKVDVIIELKIKDCEDRISKISKEINTLSISFESLIAECLINEKNFNKLQSNLESFVIKSAELAILKQQFQMLIWLSYGNTGFIDELKIYLSSFLTKADEMTNDTNGLKENFYKHLVNKFKDTSKDVSTVIIPEVDKLIDGNGWITGNLFDVYFKVEIPHKTDTSTDKDLPLRNGEFITGKTNFQSLINNILTSYMPIGDENYYDEANKNIKFFTISFENKKGDSDIQSKLDKFKELAISYIYSKILISSNQNISELIDKQVNERFNALGPDEKDSIRKLFKKDLTPVFFPINSSLHSVPQAKYLYTGPLKQFAIDNLGYSDKDNNMTFYEDVNSNEFYKIKFIPGISIDAYSHFPDLKEAYEKLKSSGRKKFYPHIDKRMNDYVEDINEVFDENQISNFREKMFTRLLLLSRLFKKAKINKSLYNKVFVPKTGSGKYEIVDCPLSISDIKKNNIELIYVSNFNIDKNTEKSKIKIQLLDMKVRKDSGDLYSFFNKLNDLNGITKDLKKFEVIFKNLIHNNIKNWNKLLEEARMLILSDLKYLIKISKADTNKLEFYSSLQEILSKKDEELLNK